MLRLIVGRAGSGKTAAVMGEIKENIARGIKGSILIVPEQYSHEAERELCRVCGDELSLYAEVLSFTGLARSVARKQGGTAAPWLDKGGRLLCMALAMKNVGSRLKLYSAARHRAEMQGMLLRAVDELKSACIDSDTLLKAAADCPDTLGDKLTDLALVLEAFDAVVANGRADPADRLSILARQIGAGDSLFGQKIYVDGFVDFTRQQQEVLRALMARGAELTFCFTLDSLDGDSEIYELSRRAGRSLIAAAKELDREIEIKSMSGGRPGAMGFFAENMFSYSAVQYDGADKPLRLYRTESMAAECEQAAALCLELVRDGGCRWRDIAICARGFEDYRGSLESVFRLYDVPLFTNRRSDMMSKPLPALISYAYAVIQGGWAVDDVISYMRTGLSGLSERDCDVLENYIFKWQIRGSAWQRRNDWRQHPEGYGKPYDEKSEEQLKKINQLRRSLARPLNKFQKDTEAAETALQHCVALSELFRNLRLPEILKARAEKLLSLGREKQAAEYRQLWDIVVSSLEQCAAILGDSTMDGYEFSKLYTLMLSKYDIGTIPVALDRVSAGDFDRNRRRNIKHLIVLGASDQRLPRADESAGVFSGDERQRLLELDIDLGSGGESELWREFSLIYNTLTMPSESLTLLCPVADSAGAELRPAFVFNRAAALFGIRAENSSLRDNRMSASAPALGLAAQSFKGGGSTEAAARDYFERTEPQRMAALEAASKMRRGSLSPKAVDKLYGKKLYLSASRIDKFAACRFAYFCQYGLKAKPYEPAGFKPPEIGTFMHYLLENTAREAGSMGGFKNVDNKQLREITDKYVAKFISEELNDFQEKSSRFVYLFKRICNDAYSVVEDMAEELRRSDFVPLDFELDFANTEELPPLELGEGADSLTLTGIADRVDGWLHEGKLYLRVVDYKTGHKEFDLSDIYYGMNLQMLMYLFALRNGGERKYKAEIMPAGVMYIPARSPLMNMGRGAGEEEILSERAKELRRSGLILDDAALQEAWEHGADKRYIPIKIRYGKPVMDSVADTEKLGVLNRHIEKSLRQMAATLRQGSIAADPYYRSQQENACMNCDFYEACHFSEGVNGESCRYQPKLNVEKVWAMMEEAEKNG